MHTIIIGGAATGMGTAAKLRRLNPEMQITVIQKESYVSLGACGIPYYIGNHFLDSNRLVARTVEKFQEQNVEVIINTIVTKVDFKNKKVYFNDTYQNYDNLVIATGSKPIVPEIENVTGKNIFTVNSKQDAEVVKNQLESTKNVLVVGSGLIGLEMVENITNYNSDIAITVIEKSNRVVQSLFDEEFTTIIEEKMFEKNITLIKNNEVEKFILNSANEVTQAILKSGENIICDIGVFLVFENKIYNF